METREYLLENFKNIQDQIKFIDQKAASIIVFYAFLMNTFKKLIENLVFKSNPKNIEISLFIIGGIFTFHILSQIYFILFKIIRPRKAIHYNGNQRSTFYYGHIKDLDKNDFKGRILNPTLNKKKEVAEQIYEIAKILDKKTNYLNRIMPHLFVSIILIILFSILTKFL